MSLKIKKNDYVVIIVGKDKGRIGRIKKVLKKKKIIIENINVVKKHQKPIPSLNNPGGIIKKSAAIDVSNVSIFNYKTKKKDRIQIKIRNKKKVRVFKSNKDIIN